MKVTVIPNVVNSLVTVTKGLVQEQEDLWKVGAPLSPGYGLNSITAVFSTRMALALNNSRRLICHWTRKLMQTNNSCKSSIVAISHHHHVALVARISLTLSHHSSLSFIAPGRSSGQHPVSSYSCWMYVHAGRPAFARPCVGVHKSTSLMSSSLLLQQCPACLVRLTWIVFVIGGKWTYS